TWLESISWEHRLGRGAGILGVFVFWHRHTRGYGWAPKKRGTAGPWASRFPSQPCCLSVAYECRLRRLLDFNRHLSRQHALVNRERDVKHAVGILRLHLIKSKPIRQCDRSFK